MRLFIDTESVPNQHPNALSEAAASVRPPASLKKAESIAAWWENEAPGAAQEAWRKQSLDGGTQGEIISIAVVDGDGREWSHCRAVGQSESALLAAFIEQVESWVCDDVRKLCGNAAGWPVDDHRLAAHGHQCREDSEVVAQPKRTCAA